MDKRTRSKEKQVTIEGASALHNQFPLFQVSSASNYLSSMSIQSFRVQSVSVN